MLIQSCYGVGLKLISNWNLDSHLVKVCKILFM